jgi:chromosome segregation ATPase
MAMLSPCGVLDDSLGSEGTPPVRTPQPEHESSPEPEADMDLESKESQLTRDVPNLLDKMNTAAGEVNTLENQTREAQTRYKKLLAQWSRLYEDFRVQYGSSIDKARPYFDAAQALQSASQHVQGVVKEFSHAASQHGQAKQELRAIEERLAYGAHKVTLDKDQQSALSSATVRVLRCQQDRDRSEQEYAKALREYQDAQEAADTKRAQVGDSVIRKALPCFRQLQQHQQELDRERRRLAELEEQTKRAKAQYHGSMRGLDKINVAVHDARKDFRERRQANTMTEVSASSAIEHQSQPSSDQHAISAVMPSLSEVEDSEHNGPEATTLPDFRAALEHLEDLEASDLEETAKQDEDAPERGHSSHEATSAPHDSDGNGDGTSKGNLEDSDALSVPPPRAAG